MDDASLDRLNPVVLITGAAAGPGAGAARELATLATGGLILIDPDEIGLDRVANSITQPPERVSTLAFDPADMHGWRRAQEFLTDHYGRVDYAVIDAGPGVPRSMTADIETAFLSLRSLLPMMRGNAQGGAVVVTGSAAAIRVDNGLVQFGKPKTDLLQLMRVAAKEGAPDKVRVNAVATGGEAEHWRRAPVFQDLVRETGNARAAFARMAALSAPVARYMEGDVSRLIQSLLTESAPLSGATLVVDAEAAF
ncbi:SDR family NAD(P)-dependent oxidoreductase [Terricaulis sp.]|uniref:SDR family NAD(P)-dependent oxidoreductase n=1 Tax=Terricaulis sp. TaxID=2768686 RepID=UPI0037830A09